MQTEIILVIIGAIIAAVLFRRSPAKIDSDIQKEKINDIELAKKAKELNKSIEQIKKELAEKQTGLTNMSLEQIENFWKNN